MCIIVFTTLVHMWTIRRYNMNDNIIEVLKISRLIIEEHNMQILSVSKKYNLSFSEADM